ncbi:hypothetical protein E4Z66_04445 [Aliishimia ponticola]|uniref:NfeD family protein n=1 Tax=Aliishimia ponticola TaxID=2499833 RepID=A0A4S4NKK7_9RHOB|nr:hypothetical protein [Aliishimia ponticola]THH38811.1 hypothetical protein E4Z66_04445 [Aliishimia ponticola]
MMAWLTTWWVWIAIGLVFGIIEVLAPGFIFLGFMLGALIVGLIALVAQGFIAGLSFNALMALFAGLSLLSWIALRLAFRRQSSGAKTFTNDIND